MNRAIGTSCYFLRLSSVITLLRGVVIGLPVSLVALFPSFTFNQLSKYFSQNNYSLLRNSI